MGKKVLLAPLDPVHDIGLKILKRGLDESGYETILMAPDTPAEEIVQLAAHEDVDAMLISRTTAAICAGETPSCRSMTSKAIVSRASPARIAIPSP